MLLVRVARGRFDPARYDEVRKMLDGSRDRLIPAIEELPGIISCYVGAEPNGTIVNHSVWNSAEQARAMDTLGPLVAFRQDLAGRGIQFEPILVYEVVWRVERPTPPRRRTSVMATDRLPALDELPEP